MSIPNNLPLLATISPSSKSLNLISTFIFFKIKVALSCSSDFWVLLLVLVVLVVEHVVLIELRIVSVMDHGGVKVGSC